jgi:LacI family transcriptional regulator
MPKGRRKAARVNQTFLAKKLGLSQFTVSEALRGSEKVALETRQRVLAAAEKAGYRVHASARATRTGRFGGIALLRGPIADVFWFPLDLLFGIEYQLDRLNQRLVMARLPADVGSDESAIPRLLRELSVDGALVHCNPAPPPALPDLLKRFSVPTIYLNVKQANDCVYPDDVSSGEQATNRLLELGHRRIVFLTRSGEHYSIADRQAGYDSAMRARGLTPRSLELPDRASGDDAEPRARLCDLLSGSDHPTGVVAYSLREADLVLHTALKKGRAIPKDLSVICAAADNTLLSENVFGVTSVEVFWVAVGCSAVELLMRKIAAPRQPLTSVAVAPRFREGRTIGPPVG